MQLSANQREIVLRLARQHGVSHVRVFGSRVRGEASAQSDLDLLVAMQPHQTLLDRIAFQQALEDVLQCSVDVVTEYALHPLLRERVLGDAVAL